MINRLKGTSLYLAGHMDNCPNGGEEWRNLIIPRLKEFGIKIYNPANKPESLKRGREDREIRAAINYFKSIGDFAKVRELAKPIRLADLRMVDLSHFVILNLDHDILTCGTHEEWVTANRQKKPIIVRCEQGKAAIPNWMFGAMPHEMFFSEWEEVIDYLRLVDSTENEELIHPRWVFV